MEKKICLALGDKEIESFIKTLTVRLVEGISSPDFPDIQQKVQQIINLPLSQEERSLQKQELLLEYFGGNKLLSTISMKKLSRYRDSGIDKITFVDDAPYREAVVNKVSQQGADIVIVTEKLQGQTNFETLLHELRVTCPNTDIIVIGGEHHEGDTFFSQVISRGIYNITYGNKIVVSDILHMIFVPKTYADIAPLLGEKKASVRPVQKPPEVTGADIVTEKAPPIPEQPKSEKPFARKKKEPEPTPVAPTTDTDMLSLPTETPNKSSETQMLSIQTANEGMVFLPYEMRPIVITHYVPKDGKTVPTHYTLFPDGHIENGTQLPAVVKPTAIETAYQEYITSLIDTPSLAGQPSRSSTYIQPLKRAKTIVFTSARQGVGCSTVALNVATALAMEDHKVLFLDTNFEHSSIYARLELPHHRQGIDDTFNAGNNMLTFPLTKQTLIASATGNHITRFKSFPDSLSFMKWSDMFQIGDASTNASAMKKTLEIFATDYEYIIIDSNLMFNNALYDEIYRFANMIFVVVTQDLYEVNLSSDALTYYEGHVEIANKIGVIVNKYVKTPPHPQDFSHDFYNTRRIFAINEDTKGFISAYSQGHIYYMGSSGNMFSMFGASGSVKASFSEIANACL